MEENNIDFPESTFTSLLHFSKKINSFKYTLRASFVENRYRQILNSNLNTNLSKNSSFVFKTKSFFKNSPNIEFSYSYEPTKYVTNINDLKFLSKIFSLRMNYEIKGFSASGGYSKREFINERSDNKSKFDIGDFMLSYRKEDSPWYYEVSANNIFNTKFERQSSISNVLISDDRTFILPRIVMFKISFSL